ncbi:MAG: hypothetical protein H6737_09465 [Alphaproteobacteria bacterium]|nr:hypothetical protein [Alphaproteobacteria bacterium]
MTSILLSFLLSGCSEYGLANDPAKLDLTDLEPNVDTDGDGIPDVNLDTDGDGVADLDIDLDGDGVPDLNIDLDGDGQPDLNIDIDGDATPDLDIDTNGDQVPDVNIDIDSDGEPEINIDTDGDGVPNINIDTDGDGLPDIDLTDTFVVPEISDVDIIFFGDTSGSMEEELSQIGYRIAEFTSRLQAAGGDWQLISVNGDQGCAIDTIFTPDTPDWANRFADAVLVQPQDEETDERGLVTVARAVGKTGPGECNEGLVRPNAMLHAIFLSDENDESPGFDSGDPNYWQQFVDRIVDAKFGVQGLTRLSAITGPTPDGCNGSDPGFGYVEAMQGTGGTFLSICDAWEEQLDLLAQASVVLDTFPLSVPADPATINVSVNLQPVPASDWVYDPVTNSVEFVANAPEVGEVVRIEYEAL